jgi:hypothetical protein
MLLSDYNKLKKSNDKQEKSKSKDKSNKEKKKKKKLKWVRPGIAVKMISKKAHNGRLYMQKF